MQSKWVQTRVQLIRHCVYCFWKHEHIASIQALTVPETVQKELPGKNLKSTKTKQGWQKYTNSNKYREQHAWIIICVRILWFWARGLSFFCWLLLFCFLVFFEVFLFIRDSWYWVKFGNICKTDKDCQNNPFISKVLFFQGKSPIVENFVYCSLALVAMNESETHEIGSINRLRWMAHQQIKTKFSLRHKQTAVNGSSTN